MSAPIGLQPDSGARADVNARPGRTPRAALIAVAIAGVAAAVVVTALRARELRSVRAESEALRSQLTSQRAEAQASERMLQDLRRDIAALVAETSTARTEAERDRAERTALPVDPGRSAPAMRSPEMRNQRAVQLLQNTTGKVGSVGAGKTPQGRALVATLIAEYEAKHPDGSNPGVEKVLADRAQYLDMHTERARLLARAASAPPAPSAAAAQAGTEGKAPDRGKQITSLLELARSLARAGDLDQALVRADEAIGLARTQPEAKRKGALLSTLRARAQMLVTASRHGDAEPVLREAYELARSGASKPTAGDQDGVNLAAVLLRLDRAADAEPILRSVVDAHAAAGTKFGATEFIDARWLLVVALRSLGRDREAAELEFGVREYAAYQQAVYGGFDGAGYRQYLETRDRVDLIEDSFSVDLHIAAQTKNQASARKAVEAIVKALEEAGSTAQGRLGVYRRWMERQKD